MPSSRLSPAKEQLIVVVCKSSDINAGNITDVLTALKSLSSDRSSALSAEGALTLAFTGYDTDPRELESIPEIRTWFAKLNAAWPYWFFFACRTDQTIPLVLSLLLPGMVVAGEPGTVMWNFDMLELKPLLLKMLAHQIDLVEKLEIATDVNERSTFDFLEAVNAFLN